MVWNRSATIAVVVAERPSMPLGSGAAVDCRDSSIAAAGSDDVAASTLQLGAPRLAGGSAPRRAAGRLSIGH